MTERKHRVAIIGCGRLGQVYADTCLLRRGEHPLLLGESGLANFVERFLDNLSSNGGHLSPQSKITFPDWPLRIISKPFSNSV